MHIGRAIRGGFPIGSRRQTSRTNPCDQPSLPWGLQTSAVLNEPLTLNGQMQTMALCLSLALVLSFPVALGYARPVTVFSTARDLGPGRGISLVFDIG